MIRYAMSLSNLPLTCTVALCTAQNNCTIISWIYIYIYRNAGSTGNLQGRRRNSLTNSKTKLLCGWQFSSNRGYQQACNLIDRSAEKSFLMADIPSPGSHGTALRLHVTVVRRIFTVDQLLVFDHFINKSFVQKCLPYQLPISSLRNLLCCLKYQLHIKDYGANNIFYNETIDKNGFRKKMMVSWTDISHIVY